MVVMAIVFQPKEPIAMITITVSKSFLIKNRKGDLVTIPAKYKLRGITRCATQENAEGERIECLTMIAEPDDDRIEEKTEIRNIPWSCVRLVDE